MTKEQPFTKSVIFMPLYSFSNYQPRDLGEVVYIFKWLNGLLNGYLLEHFIERFPVINNNSEVFLSWHRMKYVGAQCRNLTEYIQNEFSQLFEDLDSPDIIALRGLAIELVYRNQEFKYSSIGESHPLEKKISALLSEVALGTNTPWFRPIKMYITVFTSEDASVIAEYGNNEALTKIDDNLFMGLDSSTPKEGYTLLFPERNWNQISIRANPILTLPWTKLDFPKDKAVYITLTLQLLVSEVYNIFNMIDFVLVQIHLAHFVLTELFWKYVDKSGLFKNVLSLNREVLRSVIERFEYETRPYLVKESSPTAKAMERVYGAAGFEHLNDLIGNIDRFADLLEEALHRLQATSTPLFQELDKNIIMETVTKTLDKCKDLGKPIHDFGQQLQNLQSDFLSQLEIKVAIRGIYFAIALSVISILVSLIIALCR